MFKSARRTLLAVGLMVAAPLACKKAEVAKAPPPATGAKVAEATLSHVTLTPEAEARLGIVIVEAELRAALRTRTVAGDVLPSSGRSVTVVAPLAGRVDKVGSELRVGQVVHRGDPLLTLTPVAAVDRDLRASADRTVRSAESRLTAMEARLLRAEKLLADGAGSARAAEEARAERDTAKADFDAAKSRNQMIDRSPLSADVAITLRAPEDGILRTLSAPSSTVVPAGASLFELVGTGALWVRASVFVGDLRRVRVDASARVRALTAPSGSEDSEALPVAGPPTADGSLSTYDLYFALAKDAAFKPGERVAVSLTYNGEKQGVAIPTSAIVRDAFGSAWVYESLPNHAFERRRVEVEYVEGKSAFLARGIKQGTHVAATGAVELFGFELGNGK